MCGNLGARVAIRRALWWLKTVLHVGKETKEVQPSWAKLGVTWVWGTRQSRVGEVLLVWEQEEPWIENSQNTLQVFHIKGKHGWQRNNAKEFKENKYWGSLCMKIKLQIKMRFSSTQPKRSFKEYCTWLCHSSTQIYFIHSELNSLHDPMWSDLLPVSPPWIPISFFFF